MELAVLTGASRGLGLAVAEQLLDGKCTLRPIARKPQAALADRAAAQGATLEQWALDVASPEVSARLETWLQRQDKNAYDRVLLINNAGIMGRVGPIERMDPQALAAVLRVGVE